MNERQPIPKSMRFEVFKRDSFSPRQATDSFNRFGVLKLGFWGNPKCFPDVSVVH